MLDETKAAELWYRGGCDWERRVDREFGMTVPRGVARPDVQPLVYARGIPGKLLSGRSWPGEAWRVHVARRHTTTAIRATGLAV
jgi:hypothetical protein